MMEKQMSLLHDHVHDEDTQTVPSDQHRYEWRLYTDGASRNNPGPSGAGIYLLKDAMPVEKQGFFLGTKTNNQAEYLALILGLLIVKNYARPFDDVYIVSDSLLLVKQLLGEYKVKNEQLRPLFNVAHQLMHELGGVVMHVLRAENTVADKLANKGINHKTPIPAEFITILQQHAINL